MLTKDEMIDQMLVDGLGTGYYYNDLVTRNCLKKLLKGQLRRCFEDYMTGKADNLCVVPHDGVYHYVNGEKYYYGGIR